MGSIQDTIDNKNALLAAGLPASAITGYGGRLDSNETQNILQAFKASGQPYTAQNIYGTTTNPAEQPNFSDPLALRDYYLKQLGVPDAQTAVTNLTRQLNQFDTATQESLNAIENQPLRMGVITGEQAATARSAATSRDAIARELLAKQSFLDAARQEANTKFDIANNERQTIQKMIIESGGKAGITYGDTVEQAAGKLSVYQTKLAKDEKKQAEKDALKSLYTQLTGKAAKPMSLSELRKKVSKAGASAQAIKDALSNIELKLKQKELSKPYSSSTTTADSKEEAQFYNDAAALRKEMDATQGGTSWAVAWSELNQKYPGLSADAIDSALGLSYRQKYDK